MATTKCPKCESTSFELKSGVKVKNCRHHIAFIQCALCGCAISAFSERQDRILEQLAKNLGGSLGVLFMTPTRIVLWPFLYV